ncbi:MAG TPA: choice-of-anchor R domain-containing protein [Pseudomonadales bacterium]|nr:choice-of-anchor R domain-containing protein [Pseudomonadales bacterium]
MKNLIFTIVTVIGLLSLRTAQAQGVLYVSNLGQSVAGGEVIGSNSWVAQTFVTGPGTGGYLVNSVQLLIDAPSGTHSGFSVSIYSKTGDPHSEHEPGDAPQASLGSFTGPEPATTGVFSYTNPGILLASSTFYYVVVTAATSTHVGSYAWSGTTGLTQSNGFTIQDECFNSTNGSAWTWTPRKITFQLGLYASAVPPPNLSMVRDGAGNTKILWPNVGTYVLEQSTNLGGTNWTVSSYTVTNNVVTSFCNVTPVGTGLFFRLGQQLP